MTLKYPKAQSTQKTKPNFLLTHKTPITRVRKTSGDYLGGVWVDGVAEEVTILANVQPTKGSELMALPESDRSRDIIKIYTTEEILGVQEGDGKTSPDLIIWQGNTYEVKLVYVQRMGVLDHTKALAARIPISAEEFTSE